MNEYLQFIVAILLLALSFGLAFLHGWKDKFRNLWWASLIIPILILAIGSAGWASFVLFQGSDIIGLIVPFFGFGMGMGGATFFADLGSDVRQRSTNP